MHRRVKLSRSDRGANFGDKGAALAAMHEQVAGLVGIANGFELDDLDVKIRRCVAKARCNFFGLNKRHRTLARADTHRNCHPALHPSKPRSVAASFLFQIKTSRRRNANRCAALLQNIGPAGLKVRWKSCIGRSEVSFLTERSWRATF